MTPRLSRLCIPLAAGALMFGSLMAATGSAAAATTPHPGVTHVRPGGALNTFVPGGVMKHPSGPTAALAREHGIRNAEQSSNWSGYAATGGTGAFSSVSSNWTEPSANCGDG